MPEFKQSDNAAIDQAGQRAIRSLKTYADNNFLLSADAATTYLSTATAASTYLALADQTITVSTTPPGSADVGRMYIDEPGCRIYVWNGSMWSLVGGPTPAARARRSATFSLANVTNHTILWDTEDYDTDGFHSTSVNTSRHTVPSGLDGLYSVGFAVDVAAGANVASAWMVVNGGTTRFGWVQTPNVSQGVFMQGSDFLSLAAGDYVETIVYQSSGGALDSTSSSASFWMYRIGPA